MTYGLAKLMNDWWRFPFWWYGQGLIRVGKWWLKEIKRTEEHLSLVIWLKHLFQPMYAEYNISGRIISFIMRFVVLIFRLIIFTFSLIFFSIIFLLYLLILPGAVFLLVRSLGFV